MKNNIFNKSQMKKYADNKAFHLSVQKHDFLKIHAEKIKNGDFKSEKSSYLYFYDFLKEILGYERDKNILFENKEAIGRGIVEFVLKTADEQKFMVIELKDQDKELDKPQNRANDKRSPVDQAFSYAQHSEPNNPIDWIMVSNFKEFRLYNYNERSGKCICFTYEDLLDKETFKSFMVAFSKKSHISKGYPDKILKETLIVERQLEHNFYKLFHETRLMLIKELEELNDLSREQSVHYAQLILNRYMFIAFAEDSGLLTSQISTDTIITPIKKGNLRHRSIWQRLNELFLDINEGNDYKKISGYNGGLFAEDLDFLKIRDTVEDQEIFKDTWQDWNFNEYEKDTKHLLGTHAEVVNPIYKNLLTISSFDFSSELDVNILGHIFENSIGDLEELKEDSKGRRKKDGIFYTPEYITDYICRNTIIPYLSKSGNVNTVDDLVGEYWGSAIEELDQKVKDIKIVDPACGSGAFLNKAADVLVEIHQAVHKILYKDLKETLIPYFDHIGKRREILLNNIYGVDLNEESVDITKLSLFLKVCKKDKKLPDLDENIKWGNSLIDDPNYSNKPFEWKKEFHEIFHNGGFDVVIGNPPYVRADVEDEIYQKQREGIKNSGNYVTLYEKWDLYIAFIEKGLTLLKNQGIMSFIISNSFNTVKFADKSKEYILNNFFLKQIDFLKDIEVFEGVGVESVILTIVNSKDINNTQRVLHKDFFENIITLQPSNNVSEIFRISKTLNFEGKFINTELLGNICFISVGMVLNADEKKAKGLFKKDDLISDFQNKINKKPYVESRNIRRYRIKKIRYLEWDTNRVPEKIRRPTFPELYCCPKIIRGATVDGTYVESELMCNHGINVMVKFNSLKSVSNRSIENSIKKWTSMSRKDLELISSNFDLKYILAILNSKFTKFYLNTIRRHRIEFYFYPDDFKKMPIKKITLKEQQKLIEKVDNILKFNIKFQEESIGFHNWLRTTFGIDKLSQKLEKYYELDLDGFLIELKKKKVDVRSRKNQELLKEEYQKTIDIINPLLQEIEETDNMIDQMVYELYGLTDEEIKIIEDSLRG